MSLPNSWLFVMYMKTPCSIQERQRSVAFAKVRNTHFCSDSLRESLMHARLCKYGTWEQNVPGRHNNWKKSGKLFAQKLKMSAIIRAVTQFHSFSYDKTFKKKDVKEIWNSFYVVALVWGFTAAELLSGDDRGFDANKIIGCWTGATTSPKAVSVEGYETAITLRGVKGAREDDGGGRMNEIRSKYVELKQTTGNNQSEKKRKTEKFSRQKLDLNPIKQLLLLNWKSLQGFKECDVEENGLGMEKNVSLCK